MWKKISKNLQVTLWVLQLCAYIESSQSIEKPHEINRKVEINRRMEKLKIVFARVKQGWAKNLNVRLLYFIAIGKSGIKL